MKIAICSAGTRGDVQPALALAVALLDRGHEVLLIGPPENKDWAESYGCPFAGLGESHREFIRGLSGVLTPGDMLKFMGLLKRGVEIQLRELPELIGGFDLAIGISLVFGLRTVAERLGMAYLFMATTPQILPSGEYPTIALRNHNLPRWINRLDWFVSDKVNGFLWMRMVNRERRRVGVPLARGSAWRHILGSTVMLISDEELGRPPEDVTVPYRQVGHFGLSSRRELPGEVETFLSSGPPPVFVGFGSMPDKREETSRLIIEAARAAGQRMIVGSGWAELRDLDPGRDHLVVEGDIPHDKLFPRVAAVVHHGGAGTTATAARSGAPQVIVPHYFDQFYWAKRIRELGLGPTAPRHDKLTAANLGAAITEATTNPAYVEKAKDMAERLSRKDPLGEAVRVIEEKNLATKDTKGTKV